MSNLFTPRVGDKRVRMQIDDEDSAKITKGPGVKGRVTDLLTGKRYDVEGASCGRGCYCDAIAVEVQPS